MITAITTIVMDYSLVVLGAYLFLSSCIITSIITTCIIIPIICIINCICCICCICICARLCGSLAAAFGEVAACEDTSIHAQIGRQDLLTLPPDPDLGER